MSYLFVEQMCLANCYKIALFIGGSQKTFFLENDVWAPGPDLPHPIMSLQVVKYSKYEFVMCGGRFLGLLNKLLHVLKRQRNTLITVVQRHRRQTDCVFPSIPAMIPRFFKYNVALVSRLQPWRQEMDLAVRRHNEPI